MLRLVASFALVLAALLGTRPAWAALTHYWRWHERPDEAALTRCIDDMSRIADARRGILVDAHARTGSAAVFRETQVVALGDASPGTPVPAIVFNGVGDDGHEVFGFPLAPFTQEDSGSLQFVKTAGKPYDGVATACLIAARDCFPHDVLEIASDATWPDGFAEGAALYERALGRRAKNPLDPTQATVPPASAPVDDSAAIAMEPQGRHGRKNLLLGVIFVLALAIVFVLTRETRA
jgi:hypothetical protein